LGGREVYQDIDVCGKRHHCLLDTGCEKSLIPSILVPGARLRPSDVTVRAANGAKKTILGSNWLGFTIRGIPAKALFLVKDEVEEVMLGIDWLA
jgi:hypothetical protein